MGSLSVVSLMCLVPDVVLLCVAESWWWMESAEWPQGAP